MTSLGYNTPFKLVNKCLFNNSSKMSKALIENYRQISNIRRTFVGIIIVIHSDVVGESLVGAAPTTSSFST